MWQAFVNAEVVRLPLSHDQWIEVKRELTYGEQEDMFGRMRRQFAPEQTPLVDATRIGRARMEAYIVGWSFTDPSGRPVPLSASALTNLTTYAAREIRDALEEHEETVSRERESEKNDRDGASVSSPITPSAS
jgi:hypothetical protein